VSSSCAAKSRTRCCLNGPLKLGLAEIPRLDPGPRGRGEFFNYFRCGRPDRGPRRDLSGKGVGAALLMANIRPRCARGCNSNPTSRSWPTASIAMIRGHTPPEVYITLFSGCSTRLRRELRYVNAGHNPQFLLRADGESSGSTRRPARRPAARRGFEARTVAVEPGDLLFLYTDAAVEAPNESGDFFDADRLQQHSWPASAEGSARSS